MRESDGRMKERRKQIKKMSTKNKGRGNERKKKGKTKENTKIKQIERQITKEQSFHCRISFKNTSFIQ